ncbi:MAG: hypothetical protein U0470_07280 [Anaerolineae bacterium]
MTVAAVGAAPSRERRVVRAGLVVAAYGRSSGWTARPGGGPRGGRRSSA